MIKRFWALYLMIFSLSACAVVQSEFDYTVAVNQNMFSVQLTSNPTTGYQWILAQYDQRLLKLNASQFIASKSRLFGASGQMIFNFSIIDGAARPQTTVMKFVYRRPWEPNTGKSQDVTIHFNQR